MNYVRNRIHTHKWVWHRTSSTCLIKLTVSYCYVTKPVNVYTANATDADGRQWTQKYRPYYVYCQNSICLSRVCVIVTDCFAYYFKKIFLSNAQFQDKKTSHAGCRSVYIFQRKWKKWSKSKFLMRIWAYETEKWRWKKEGIWDVLAAWDGNYHL